MMEQSLDSRRRLVLEAMHERHRALTPSIAGSYEEAAAVCLSKHHEPPVEIELSNNGDESVGVVSWKPPDKRTLDAWGNLKDATEDGAYGCVIAGVEEMRGLFAVRRAEQGTGSDYYIGPPGSGEEDLEDCVRLEVSGVLKGTENDVKRRLIEKVAQARAGSSSLPAVAGVIGFSVRLLALKDVPEKP